MKKLQVCPGVCGLESIITAEDDDGEITLTIETKCPHVQEMFDSLEQPFDPWEICFSHPGTGPIYEAAESLPHGACVVPSALVKCIEAEANLALPRPITMKFID